MIMREFKLLVVLLVGLAVLTFIISGIVNNYITKDRYDKTRKFEHIIAEMKNVPHGEIIEEIKVRCNVDTFFDIKITENTLPIRWVYEFGKSLTSIIDEMYSEIGKIKGANVWDVYISIHPISDPNQTSRSIGFGRTRPTYDLDEPAKLIWVFHGDLDGIEKVWYVTPPIKTTE